MFIETDEYGASPTLVAESDIRGCKRKKCIEREVGKESFYTNRIKIDYFMGSGC